GPTGSPRFAFLQGSDALARGGRNRILGQPAFAAGLSLFDDDAIVTGCALSGASAASRRMPRK
ncbi:hypothetical protein, partial [Escherichia coli]|uniref:hypothetical protein n=1 Tax=Escherichia coli TaxID=562 RepID=UPI001BDC7320